MKRTLRVLAWLLVWLATALLCVLVFVLLVGLSESTRGGPRGDEPTSPVPTTTTTSREEIPIRPPSTVPALLPLGDLPTKVSQRPAIHAENRLDPGKENVLKMCSRRAQ